MGLQPRAREVAEARREVLIEFVLDLGRLPEVRLTSDAVKLDDEPLARPDLDAVLARLGPLGPDNRAGIERTLHRISAIRNRKGDVVGLTLRVGRSIVGTIDMIRDLFESGRNVLLLGRPGVGKTTKLREAARVLADDVGKRVVIVDTSNEIGGDGDVPHPGVGGARRMQVATPDRQHAVMIEAVENHMPEVVVIDEVGTAAEAAAARTIAERGVQLIATAHGTTLENLVLNPILADLVGGVHTVTLSDEEVRRQRRAAKTVNERRAPPTFDIIVELVNRDEVLVHDDTARAVDRLLAGAEVRGERRYIADGGQIRSEKTRRAAAAAPAAEEQPAARRRVRFHAYAIGREIVERAVSDLGIDGAVVESIHDADVIVALAARASDPRVRRASVPVYTVKRNAVPEVRRVLRAAFGTTTDESEVRDAVREVEHAVSRILADQVPIVLSPRSSDVRELQRRVAARYHLEVADDGTLRPAAAVRPDHDRPG